MIATSRLFLMALAILLPAVASAQTGGPGQPEFMQFQQAGTSDLVSPSTGTFTYQIPLFSIGGYPMNLTYQSGIRMEDVASMVGLGWNLNPGSVVRTLRGIPDDFDGDEIIQDYSVKPDSTIGGKLDIDVELAGLPVSLGLSAGSGVFHNNYNGWGVEMSFGGTVGAGVEAMDGVGLSGSLGMGGSLNSQSGVDRYISPNVGLKLGGRAGKLAANLGFSWSANSIEGARASVNAGLSLERYAGQSKSVVNGQRTMVDDYSSVPLLGATWRTFLNNSFQPDIEHPFETISGTFSGAVGADFYYVDPSARLTGYFTIQRLVKTRQVFNGIGIMYDREPDNDMTLMDFNREKKLPYFLGESKILPVPYRTPDIFNLNAQGLSTTLSLMKNDVGVVGDPRCVVSSNGLTLGLEANLGGLFKAGGNLGVITSTQSSERWKPVQLNLGFAKEQSILESGAGFYQQEYFKNHGEVNRFDHTLFTLLGARAPVNFHVRDEQSIDSWLNNGGEITTDTTNESQPVLQSAINYLTASEASVMGFDKTINYFTFDGTFKSDKRAGEEANPRQKGHHLSELSVTKPDGMKYVFGIPVYNVEQKEATFNVGRIGTEAQVDCERNLVSYSPGVDNSVNNQRGIDHYFEAMTTPPYATQFLITAVLNPDYRDLTNNGISDDDLGNYVKFSYYKEKETDLYQWRSPIAKNTATYNQGLRTDPDDDKGSYIFGRKELYYLKSIESRSEVAEFYYSQRLDGLGVMGEDGGIDVQRRLRKLDSIRVFSSSDRRRNGANAVPVKTIHFTYDYSLCPGTENSITGNNLIIGNPTHGKLTLKQVAFTYERSLKGMLTPYAFEYGMHPSGDPVNPSYNARNVNRWGYFQENPSEAFSDCNPMSALSNVDAPYASQDKPTMDSNAYAWNLTGVTIPGGGKLRIDYEAHDYGYIQNKAPGRMFHITGLSELSVEESGDNSLYPRMTEDPVNVAKNHSRIYFKLDVPLRSDNRHAELKQRYIRDLEDGYLYYKVYVRLIDEPGNEDQSEFVSGYARIKGYGVIDNEHAYVDLEDLPLDEDLPGSISCSPILKSAIQFMRINRSKMVYGGVNNNPPGNVTDLASYVLQLPNIYLQLASHAAAAVTGINLFCKLRNFCRTIDLSKSFLRFYDPDGFKIAGGSRVRSIAINDRWDTMTGNTHEGKAYSTTYNYTTVEEGDTISSGVAEYEPMIGGDEISLKQPVFYSDVKQSAPDNQYYVEDPVNESLFPAPNIVYGIVTQVTSGSESGSDATSASYAKTGRIVNEFYTARDYPVKVSRTPVEVRRDMSDFLLLPLGFNQQHDFATVSQGYAIELNNMSGLPKATWAFNEKGDRITGQKMEYYPDNEKFTTIDHSGRIHTNTKMGITTEYTVDGRRSSNKSENIVLQVNFNLSEFGGIPVPILIPVPSVLTDEKQFQSIVVNKLICRNAVLKRKTVFEQSAAISTENLAFDEVTGETLLTKTTNEFNDTLFSFNYPAYWIYEGMGPTYRSMRVQATSGNAAAVAGELQVGDELRNTTIGSSSPSRLWLQSKSPARFVDEKNEPQSISGTYMVYNTGAKNELASSAGGVVTWNHDPLAAGQYISFGTSGILNSTAIEYADRGVAYCDSCSILAARNGKNDFIAGRRGNWKPVRNWFYLTERTTSNLPVSNTDIRTQGLFAHYTDFWTINQGASRFEHDPNESSEPNRWEWKEKNNLVDIDGQTIESEDRIGRKTASLLGYRNTLVLAQAFNASYGEALYDGFEDYMWSYCVPDKPASGGMVDLGSEAKASRRMRVLSGSMILTDQQAHSGKYSLQVPSLITFGVMPPIVCDSRTTAPGNPPRKDTVRGRPSLPARPVLPNNIGLSRLRGRLTSSSTSPSTPSTCNECVGGFYPEPNKSYLISCWARVDGPEPILSCSDATVEIQGADAITLHPEGPVIEGWQRVMGEFRTGSSVASLRITLRKGGGITWFDDLRVIPADGNMVSYVYDDLNHRLTHNLDENNYFTKYEYNNQGELIRVKKETERGIFTIREGNQSLVKQQ